MATFYVTNFGCRATQADGAAIERQLREGGLERAPDSEQAGLVVLNTCTVTAAADQDARAAIRRIHRRNPKAQIVVTGCYAQRAPDEIAALPGVAQVIGNSHKHRLAEIVGLGTSDFGLWPAEVDCRTDIQPRSFIPLTSLTSGARGPMSEVRSPKSDARGPMSEARSPKSDARSPIFVSDIFAHTELLAAPVFDSANERTRPNLKVQDGCDNRCSFCVIPSVRGQSRSLPLDEVIRQVDALVSAGYREVVISGINLGRWGRDLSSDGGPRSPRSRSPRFEDLVGAILSETRLEKLRISSVEPMDWSDELIDLMAHSPRIARHAHVPLQSGSDAVLRRMHRRYRPWHYREKIEKIHAALPTAAIGADVMVGFPGESEREFEETRRLVEELPFTYLHVFTYSPRPGTPASAMDKQIPANVGRGRNRILRDLAAEKKLAFMRGFLGQPVEVIVLNLRGTDQAGAYSQALSDNYLPMRVRGSHPPNRWLLARVDAISDDILLGSAA